MEPLLIHHHLPKTAGTSLARVLRANFSSPGELAEVRIEQITASERLRRDIDIDRPSAEPFLRWWREWYESLGTDGRARLRCVRSHSAQLLIPAVTDRPVRPFTVLRDPVERVVSLYDATLAGWARRSGAGTAGRVPALMAVAQTIDENGWSLADLYREVGSEGAPAALKRAFSLFFNGQTTEILAPHLPPGEPIVTSDPERLERRRRRAVEVLSTYVVGTQDRFSESVRLFADSFGWGRVFVPRANVGSGRTQPDEETRALIRAHNTVDAELHSHHSARLQEHPAVGRVEDVRQRTRLRARRSLARAHRAAGRPLARTAGRRTL